MARPLTFTYKFKPLLEGRAASACSYYRTFRNLVLCIIRVCCNELCLYPQMLCPFLGENAVMYISGPSYRVALSPHTHTDTSSASVRIQNVFCCKSRLNLSGFPVFKPSLLKADVDRVHSSTYCVGEDLVGLLRLRIDPSKNIYACRVQHGHLYTTSMPQVGLAP
jgi:hypothetical protein